MASANPSIKKSRMGQSKSTHADDGLEHIGTQKGNKETNHLTNGQWKQAERAQEAAPNPITQEPGRTKRPAAQEVGSHKKMKEQ
jgi:hypothetical protein